MTPSARLTSVRMYEQTGDAGLTCRRCGVSRPTLAASEGEDNVTVAAAG